jgi:hypothetical protein
MDRHAAYLLVSIGLICGLSRAADVPPRSEAGQTLVPPKADLDRGDIYHIYGGEDAQIVITSDAQLQRIVATTRRVVGYFVVPFDRGPSDPPIVAGCGRIPVAALDAGTTAVNDLIRGPLLDAEKNTEITFTLNAVRDAKKTPKEGEPEQFAVALEGQVNVKGKTVPVTAAGTVTMLPFTFRTMLRYPGDILTLRTSFELKLADLGLEKPGREWADKFADTLRFDVFLLANTVSPEKSLDPATKQPDNLRHIQFLTQVRDFDDPTAGYAFGRKYMKEVWNDPAPLNRLAFDTIAEDGIRTRDLAFALEAAKRAVEIEKGESAATLDTLARVHFERGEIDEAIRVQQKAVEKSATLPPPAAQPMKEALARYEKRRSG